MQIQSWEVLECLGAGGMGTVYKVRHQLTDEIRAIKTLNKSLCLDAALRQRFKNEARIMCKLNHQNIVKVYDYLEDMQEMHIVMEYVEGMPLSKLIGEKTGPIPYQKALVLFNQIAAGVAYAHSLNILHRDIKPSNVIVNPQGEVKIIDFGIAKADDIEGGTKTGMKMGTLMYMPPEQVDGKPADKYSDLYSLSMTLYEMLAGRLPFNSEERTSEFKIMNAIMMKTFPPPTDFYPHIPENIVNAVMRSISKEKHKRHSGINEFIAEINNTIYAGEPFTTTATEFKISKNTDNYPEVKIGTQIWMQKNLDVDHFRNGDPIPEARTNEEWLQADAKKQPAWCYYDNDPQNGCLYGKLYNGFAVNDIRALAPSGWRIPELSDFKLLKEFANGDSNKLKAIGEGKSGKNFLTKILFWDGSGTNESGFSALLAGYRSVWAGEFKEIGEVTSFWSPETDKDNYYDNLSFRWDTSYIYIDFYGNSGSGFSVRAIKMDN